MNRRAHRQLFEDEEPVVKPQSTPSPPPFHFPNMSHRQYSPVITPPPQGAHGRSNWTSESHVSPGFGNASQLKNQQTPTKMPSQDVRCDKNPRSPLKNISNRSNNFAHHQNPKKMANNYDKRKSWQNQRKSFPLNSNQTHVELKATSDSKGSKRRRSGKKKNEDITIAVRTVPTLPPDNRSRAAVREPCSGKDRSSKKSLKASEEKMDESVALERPEVNELNECAENTQETVEEGNENKNEEPLFYEMPEIPESHVFIEDQTPESVENLLDDRLNFKELKETVEDLVTSTVMQEGNVEKIPCGEGRNRHAPPRKSCSLEEDLEIGQFARATSPISQNQPSSASTERPKFTYPQKTLAQIGKRAVTSSPALLVSSPNKPESEEREQPTNESKYLQALALLNKLQAEKSCRRNKFTMFLPTAFSDPTVTESTIAQLYGRFQVSEVFMHYDKNGVRLGSGSMKIEKKYFQKAQNFAADRSWRAVKTLQVSTSRTNPEVTIYLMHLPLLEEDIIQKTLKDDFEATQFRMLYNYEGKTSRSAIFRTSKEKAEELNRKIRSPDEFIFDSSKYVFIFELLDV